MITEMGKRMERDKIMERARANRCMVDAYNHHRDAAKMEMAGFLDLMHPEMSDERKRKLILAAQ